jgi:DNA repair photolyase
MSDPTPDTTAAGDEPSDQTDQPWEERGGVKYGDDPTQQILGESDLNKKTLCDYNINVAVGCKHGCTYCYVPSTPQIRTRTPMLAERAGVEHYQDEWGSYVLHREAKEMGEELRARLANKRKWRETRGGRGVVAMSFHTDCYQDRRTADATRACAEALFEHGKHVRILTRNPILALQDLDLYEQAAADGLVTVGTSVPSLASDDVAAIEPGAPLPEHRLRGLAKFAEAGVPTFVSMSPVYPTATPEDIRKMLRTFQRRLPTLDCVFSEVINPRGANYPRTIEMARDAGRERLAAALEQVSGGEDWRVYAVQTLRAVQRLADYLSVPVKLWPGHDLVTATEGTADERWVRGAWLADSPEDFARP